MSVLIVQHQKQAGAVLERIEAADTATVCVGPEDNPTAKSPFMKYYQRELFMDWTMPATIYNKRVHWCE